MAKSTTDALKILQQRTGVDLDADPEIAEIREDYRIAQMMHDARQAAGMTQQQLADAIGTTKEIIGQLEDADYSGHSLSMLRRVAKALGHHVEIRLVPDDEKVAAGIG